MKLITTVITALAIFFALIAWKPADLNLEPSAKRTSAESPVSALDNLSEEDFCYDNGDGISISFEKSGRLIITADDAVRDDEIEIGIENNQLYIASSIAGAKNQKKKQNKSFVNLDQVSSKKIIVYGGDGDDNLIINYSKAMAKYVWDVEYYGETNKLGTIGDVLTIDGDAHVEEFVHTGINKNDGSIGLDKSSISYYGLEPVTNTGTVSDIILNYPVTSETITISDSGGGTFTVSSTAAEMITFLYPTNSLTINSGGTGDDVIIINNIGATMPDNLNLIINGESGNDTIQFNDVSTNPSSVSITVDGGPGTDVLEIDNRGSCIRDSGSTATVVGYYDISYSGIETKTYSASINMVTNTMDSGPGSLRYALENACPGDTIRFDTSIDSIPILLTGPEIILDTSLVIIGNGATKTIIDGDANNRIFYIPFGDTIYIEGIKMQNGNGEGVQPISGPISGGAIANEGSLIMKNSMISGNAVYSSSTSFPPSSFGGGVYNSGIASFMTCTISGNTVSSFSNIYFSSSSGGGVYNGGIAIFTNSEISGNLVSSSSSPTPDNLNGGGVYNGGTATFTTCTISGNTVSSSFSSSSFISGGGVHNGGTATFTTCTISNNTDYFSSITASVSYGGGVYNAGSAAFTNSIIAKNTIDGSGPNIYQQSGSINDNGYNLISDTSGVAGSFPMSTLKGSTAMPLDPLLGPLADNGGPTQTHALLCSSPAYNTGTGTDPDQRGQSVFGGAKDIGAYESQTVLDGTGPPITKLYVDIDATGAGSGNDWANAMTQLSVALTYARSCGADTICVAEGVYMPMDSMDYVPSDSRNKSFTLIDGLVLLGGFDPGAGKTSLDNRDWMLYPTILQGDLMGNDTTHLTDIYDMDDAPDRQDNVRHVIAQICAPVSITTLIDGFYIEGGNAEGDGFEEENGGGMFLIGSRPLIRNCHFRYNAADDEGGGLYADNGCSLDLKHVYFSYNYSDDDGGGIATFGNICIDSSEFFQNITDDDGGAIISDTMIIAKITHTSFHDNMAYENGGAVYFELGSMGSIKHSFFTGNSVYEAGGAIANGALYDNLGGGMVTIDSTIFTNNNSDEIGGAISNFEGKITVTNTEFNENLAFDAGGAIVSDDGQLSVIASTFKRDSSGQGGAIATASYIEFGGPGTPDIKQNLQKAIELEEDNPYLLVSKCTFEENWAADYGGAIEIIEVPASIDESLFKGNEAESEGGAIDINGGVFACTNSLFSDNYAGLAGGAIWKGASCFCPPLKPNETKSKTKSFSYWIENRKEVIKKDKALISDSRTQAKISNTTFSNNIAEENGGAVYFDLGSMGSIIHSSFTENMSYEAGGAIANGALFEDLGGGMVIIDSSDFTKNYSYQIGGAISNFEGKIIVTNTEFNENLALDAGGAIVSDDGQLSVIASTFKRDSSEVGGAIATANYLDFGPPGPPKIKQSIQKAYDVDEDNPYLLISTCTFEDNWASDYGGALEIIDVLTSIDQSSFRGNIAESEGGAVDIIGGAFASTNSLFSGNYAGLAGGAIWKGESCGCPLLKSDETKSKTKSFSYWIENRKEVIKKNKVLPVMVSGFDIVNCTFSGNYAAEGAGSIFIEESESIPDLKNNSSIKSKPASGSIINTVLWNNKSGGVVGSGYEYSSASHLFVNSIAQGSGGKTWMTSVGIDGGGNQDTDPLFKVILDPDNAPSLAGDFNLQCGSPAIDKGTPDPSSYPIGDFDLSGNARIIAKAIDIGAYEEVGTCQEIAVLYNGVSLAIGDDTPPSPIDGTAYGEICTSKTDSFYIKNIGTQILIIDTITAMGIAGSAGAFDINLSDFMFPDSINCGDSSLLAIRFNPLATGRDSATISIENNDIDEDPFTFVVSGTLDTIKPIALCQDTTIYLNAAGMATIDSVYIISSISDACGIASALPSMTSFTCTDVGGNTVTLTVTDQNGNQNTCTASVTVRDTIKPVAVCIDTTIYLNAAGMVTIDSAYIISSISDACGIVSAVPSMTIFTCTNAGANTVTLTVTDQNGNQNVCNANVVVEDFINNTPYISGPAVICFGLKGFEYAIVPDPTVREYRWSYDGSGATINSNGTSKVSIDFSESATAGTLQVELINMCERVAASASLDLDRGSDAICGLVACINTNINLDTELLTSPGATEIYRVLGTISSSAEVQRFLEMQAQISIELYPGFTVNIGDEMNAKIAPCLAPFRK